MAALLQQVEVDAGTDAARRERFPAGAAIAFSDLEEAGGEAALDGLREAEPVSWLPALGGWLVTGHAQAREALSPRARDDRGGGAEPGAGVARADDADLRRGASTRACGRPSSAPFRMREAGDLFGAAITEAAAQLTAAIVPAGECELGADFAAPFAIRMAGRMLGLSLGDAGRIDAFYDAFAGAMSYDGNPEPQRLADAARADLDGILHAEIGRCRTTPDASLTSQVANDVAAGTHRSRDRLAAARDHVRRDRDDPGRGHEHDAAAPPQPGRARRGAGRRRGARRRRRRGPADDPAGRLHGAVDDAHRSRSAASRSARASSSASR